MGRIATWIAIGALIGASSLLASGTEAAETQTPILQQCGLGSMARAAYSPDGRRILTGGSGGAFLWDVDTGEVIRQVRVAGHSVGSLAFSGDGSKALTAGLRSEDGPVAVLWDTETGKEIRTLPGPRYHVALSPDGTKALMNGTENDTEGNLVTTVELWDLSTGTVTRTLRGHTQGVTALSFSPDGTKALAGGENDPLEGPRYSTKLYNLATGEEMRTFIGHSYPVCSLAFSPDGTKVLTGGYDDLVILWNAITGAKLHQFSIYTQGGGPSVAFSPDGAKVLAGGYGGVGPGGGIAVLWDAATYAQIHTFSGHASPVIAVGFSPDGTKILTASNDNTAKLWDIATGAEVRTFSGHNDLVHSVAFSPDGTMALAGGGSAGHVWSSGQVGLWDVATGRLVRALPGHSESVMAVAFSPDGTKAFTGSFDWTAKLWDLATGTEIRTFPHGSWVDSVAFSPDGTKVLTGWGDFVTMWDVATGAEIHTFPEWADFGAPSVAFSPDGARLATGGYGEVTLWDAETWAEIQAFSGLEGDAISLAFSPDGTKILAGNDASWELAAKLWDVATGKEIRTFSGHTDEVSVAFSPDGSQVLTGSDTARLWDVATGDIIRTFSGHASRVNSVAFSPDGTKIMTGGEDGLTLVWEISPPRAVVVAGGGDFPGNAIGRQTEELGAFAFRTLRGRGYLAEDILYLSAFGEADADGDGLNDVDGLATLENLEAALVGAGVCQTDGSVFRAGEAGRLFVVLIDHGYKTEGFAAFRLNPQQVVSGETFGGWIDELQTASPQIEFQLMADCCYSGAFIEPLRNHPLFAERRVLIASAGTNQEAMFIPPPDLTSFAFSFLSSAYMGNSFGEAWRTGRHFFECFPVTDQTPVIDDGTTSTLRADRTFFGRSWTYGVQSTQDVNRFFPAFPSEGALRLVPLADPFRNPPVVFPGESFRIEARLLPFQRAERVVLAVRPPAPEVIAGEPVTALPRVELALESDDYTGAGQLWSAVVDTATTDSAFASEGSYRVSATARFGFDRVANPAFANVVISQGFDPDTAPIRAVIAIGQGGDGSVNQAIERLGDYSHTVFDGRFRNQDGAPQPDWIDYFTPDSSAPGRDWANTNKARFLHTLEGDYNTTCVARLYVHIAAPAAFDPAADPPEEPAFYLAVSPSVMVSASELDAAFDAFQALPLAGGVTSHEIILILDTPYAGAYLPLLAGPDRIIFCSGRETDPGLYEPGLEMSATFSGKFLGAAMTGADLRESFRAARNFFRAFTSQAPIYDDTGDGVYGNDLFAWRYDPVYGDPAWQGVEQDGRVARERWLGRRYAFAGDESGAVPFVLSASIQPQTVDPGDAVEVKAVLLEGVDPERVVARLLPPGSARSGSDAGLIELPMTRLGAEATTWSLTLNAPTDPGEWSVTVLAQYANGVDEGGQPRVKDSEPVNLWLSVLGGPPADAYDVFFSDDGQGHINHVPVNIAQHHNFDGPGDIDRFRFTVEPGVPHSIHIDTQEADANPVLSVYLDGPGNPPVVINDGLEGPGEYELFTLPLGTTGNIEATVANDIRGGLATGYTLTVSRDVGPNTGIPTVGAYMKSIGVDGGPIGPGEGKSWPRGAALPSYVALQEPEPQTDHYDMVVVDFPAGALTELGKVFLTGAFGIEDDDEYTGFMIFADAFENWRDQPLRAQNFTPIEVAVYPSPPGGRLAQPLTVRMQLLNDASIRFPDGHVEDCDDLPAGTTARQAEIWAWSPDQWPHQWVIVASPRLGDSLTISGNLVTAQIPPERLHFSQDRGSGAAGSVYLAVAPTLGMNRVSGRVWGSYP